MQRPPFEDARDKVSNAREHIALAEKRFAEYLAKNQAMRIRGDPSGRVFEVRALPELPQPKKVSLAVGDAIHNLRSALDVLAGDVIVLSGRKRNGVAFPFAGAAEELDGQIKRKRFNHATPEALALLKSMQPYTGGNMLLRALHDLDNANKHELIIVTQPQTTIGHMRVGNAVFTDCAIGEMYIQGHPAPIMSDVRTDLIFGYAKPLAGVKVLPTLHNFAQMTDGIIQSFAALFLGQDNGTPGVSVPLL